jgi:hypothetical protein
MRALQVPSQASPGFQEVSPQTSGVLFSNYLSDAALVADSSLLSGSGVALGDVDGDGRCDIYFCSLTGSNRLYRNLGNLRFEDITESSGTGCPGQVCRGAAFADVDGDGDLDLLVTSRGGGVRLFVNDGKGRFQGATASAGLSSTTGSTSLALADLDGDGTLDLYVANFGVGSVLRDGGKISTRMVNGRLVVMGRHAKRVKVINGQFVEFGEADALYLNDGKGRFKPLPWDQGAFLDEDGKPAETPLDFGLAVQIRDLNGDRFPDIYVCNDFFTPDRVWINDGKGRFRAIEKLAIRKSSYAAMGVDFADIDRDGNMDGFVVEMLSRDPASRIRQMTPDTASPPILGGLDRRPQAGRNTLLWNRGDGTFAEIAEYAGVAASDWTWMPMFLDVDLDGFEDVLTPNGPTYDLLDLDQIERGKGGDPRAAGQSALTFPPARIPNCAFRNLGNLRFAECGKDWGFDSMEACNGMAAADLDGDGDLDLVINCLNHPAILCRNQSAAPRIAVRLKGAAPNTAGIGAMIVVRGGAVPFQSQEMIAGGRYESGDDPMRVFAAGSATNRLTVEVTWRSGKRSVMNDARPNCIYEIEEPAGAVPAAPPSAQGVPALFEDVSNLLGHRHHEEAFEDLELQPGLPKRLSQLGPGVAWCDLDGDQKDELIIGAGRNGTVEAYRWTGSKFESAPQSALKLAGDSAGMAVGALGGKQCLLVAQSSYETQQKPLPGLIEIHSAPGQKSLTQTALSVTGLESAAAGPLAVADIDGDGQLEVFVGGRVVPRRYPEPASSFILRNHDGSLVVDARLSEALKNVGLVSGAIFSDLDGDGLPELIIASEWAPIRVFRCRDGSLQEITAELGLDKHAGLWQSVTVGDFDGDGRMDLIAGNWGLNQRRAASAQKPFALFYGDFNGDGGIQVLETERDATGSRLLSLRDLRAVSAAMPFVLARFPDHRSFAQAGAEAILGDRFPQGKKLEANCLASMVFLNRGGLFEAIALPEQAQWAPVFGISVGDFDGDGFEDVALAQNFFGLPCEAWSQDAGRGLLLKGDGKGRFRQLSGQESGIRVYGEQRGGAASDYDGDGRLDLVIAQNAEATRVFHNVAAKPGLRVRLKGPAGNPSGIGAAIRLRTGSRAGPAREIHGGSGYWSQDSMTQVMRVEGAEIIEVRWPGGKTTTCEIPAGAKAIEVDQAKGTVRVF